MKWHFPRRIPVLATVAALVIMMLAVGVALALTMSNADGRWSNVLNSAGGTGVGCLRYGNGTTFGTDPNNQDGSTTDENQARWGGIDNATDCTPNTSQSGFGFNGTDGPLTFNPGVTFLLGKFTHFNNPVYFSSSNDTPVSMDLAMTLNFTDPPSTNVTFDYSVQFDETQNNLANCPYGDSTGVGCDDRVTFPGSLPNQTFTVGGVQYTLQVIGFVPDADGTCPAAPASSPSSIYTTGEGRNNYACLYAQIVLPVDFGDAPNTAGQTTLPSGARHNITATGSYLGALRGDGDADGQPNAAATGDDANAFDDEDGFVSMDTNWGDGTGFVNVSVTRGTIPGITRACVWGWIDWGNDGFGFGTDSTANVSRNTSGTGTHQLTFNTNVPAPGSFPPFAYLRLRVVSSTTTNCPTVAPTGLQTEGEVEDYRLSFMPLAVDLASFTAAAAPEGVTLAWQTVSELDSAGFNVYRSESDAGPWVKLTETLIPTAAPGSAEGQAYTWTDTTAQAGLTYFYQLEDVALSGATTVHAPVSVTLVGPNAVGLAGFGATAATATPALAGLAGIALAALAGAGLRRRR